MDTQIAVCIKIPSFDREVIKLYGFKSDWPETKIVAALMELHQKNNDLGIMNLVSREIILAVGFALF